MLDSSDLEIWFFLIPIFNFRMLTGDEIMSGGEAILHGTSLRSNRSEYLSNIGYCPQFDSIIDVMTGIRQLFNFRATSLFSHAQKLIFLGNLFEFN